MNGEGFGRTGSVWVYGVIAIIIHSLWGGNTVAVKFSLLAFPPMWTAFFRFLLGVLCIFLWAKLNNIRIWPSRRELSLLLLLSVLFTVQIGTMNTGIDLSTGSISAILMATNPLFAACFTHFMLPDDHLTPLKTLGLVVAFAGTGLVLLQTSNLDSLQLFNLGNWILLFSAALLGLRLAYSAQLVRNIDPVRVIIWQMAFSLPLFALGGALFESISWDKIGWQPLAGLLYQGVVIAGLGFMVNTYMIKLYRPSVIVSFNFVSPISGVLLSMWLLNEPLTWQLLIGMLTVGLGLYLIARR